MTLITTLEPVAPKDRASFMAMAEQHFCELNSAFVPHPDWESGYFETIRANSNMFLCWIMLGERRAGFVLYGLEPHRFLPRRSGLVYELYVAPEFRRRGVARQCALLVIHEMQAKSPSKIQLEVVEGNSGAEALWKSLGFEKASSRYILAKLRE